MKTPTFCSAQTKKLNSTILLMAVLLACSVSSQSKAQTQTIQATQATATSPSSFQIGIMNIEKKGNTSSNKPALIFIPGLTCDAQSWENTVPAFEKDHPIYLITFAGFSGKPALANMDAKPRQLVEKALLELLQKENLNKPILIGHSIGATLSTWFATTHSDKIRGVVAVDGLPVMPFSENMTLAQRTAMATQIREQMQSLSQEQQAVQQKNYMRNIGMINEKQADAVAARSGLSDPKTVAHFMADIFEMDIRADLGKIKVPVMLVSPYYAPDMMKMNMSEEAKHAYWAKLAQGIPQLTVVGIAGSRHFPMYDQSDVFNRKVHEFVQQF